jgi:hypothetical protein
MHHLDVTLAVVDVKVTVEVKDEQKLSIYYFLPLSETEP